MDKQQLETKDIQNLLAHRYPFLLVDRVLSWTPNERITTLKNVTSNEPHFPGHFPGSPIMPGVLIVEAMAQSCGVLVRLSESEDSAGRNMFLAGISKARFKRPVLPGDTLEIEAVLERSHRNIAQFDCMAKVNGQLVSKAELLTAYE